MAFCPAFAPSHVAPGPRCFATTDDPPGGDAATPVDSPLLDSDEAMRTVAFRLPASLAEPAVTDPETTPVEVARAAPAAPAALPIDDQATATFRLPAPVPSAPAALPAVTPEVDVSATVPMMRPVALPVRAPDDQATATFRLEVPVAVVPSPDDQATSTFRLSTPGPASLPQPVRVAVPVDPDSQATATFRAPTVAIADNPDAAATSVVRLGAATESEAATLPAMRPVLLAAKAAAPVEPPPVVVPPPPVVVPPPVVEAAQELKPKKKAGYLGRVFGNRFEVKSFLGSGAFGSTYVALDQRFRRDAVLKLLRPMSSSPTPFEQEMRKRFGNEAVTLAHLVHPNITQVFDHGEEADGTDWIAMEYVPGRSLTQVQKDGGALEPHRVSIIGAQIASALAFAHSRGIVHRDLKPDNVLVVDNPTGGEQVKVLDFGIARILDAGQLGLQAQEANLTQVGAFLGTPAFMSPEQAEGSQVGPASDVYSLGVMLYLLVTGVLPGQVPSAWNPMTTAVYVASPFEPVRKLRPDCPPMLAELIEQMLVKHANERTLSAAQAQTDLNLLQPTMHQQVARGPRTPRQAPAPVVADGGTNKLVMVLAIVMSIVAIGAVVGLVLTKRELNASVATPAPVTAPVAPPVAPAPVAPTPVVAAAPAPDPAAPSRDESLRALLLDARRGLPIAQIEDRAKALRAGGDDPRLGLARALARMNERDWDGAMILLDEAQKLTTDGGLVTQITSAREECIQAKVKAASRPQKPRRTETPTEAERPEY